MHGPGAVEQHEGKRWLVLRVPLCGDTPESSDKRGGGGGLPESTEERRGAGAGKVPGSPGDVGVRLPCQLLGRHGCPPTDGPH
jgi:hypothetical protein